MNIPTSVYTITLLAPSDVRVTMADETNGTAIALGSPCDPTMFSEVGCSRAIAPVGFPPMGTAPNLFIRSLPAGTYTLVIATSAPGAYQFTVRIGTGTTPPAGDGCPPTAPSVDVTDTMPQSLNLATLDDTIAVSCNTGTPSPSGVFHMHLSAPRNVNLNVTSLVGTNYVSVRPAPCPGGAQLRCLTGTNVMSAFRNLAAGDYFVIVQNNMSSTVTVSISTSDPGMRVVGDACVNPAAEGLGTTFPESGTSTVDFSTLLLGADHGTPCGSGAAPDNWRDAVYTYTLAAPSDVTINITPTGSWSPPYFWTLETACGNQSTAGRCFAIPSSTSSTRILGQPAGTYYLVLETMSTPPAGSGFRVDVTATDPAARPAYEACPGASIALTPSGSMLVGSTTINASSPALNRVADVGTTCGSGSAPDGWTDVIASFTLTSTRTVSLSISPTSSPWFVEVDSSCSRSSHLPGCTIAGAGSSTPIPLGSLAAGTYYIVAETSFTPPGNITINVNAI
jgi:hypothetical protein